MTRARTYFEPASERATFYFTRKQLLELEVLMLRIRTEIGTRPVKNDLIQLAVRWLLAQTPEQVNALLEKELAPAAGEATGTS